VAGVAAEGFTLSATGVLPTGERSFRAAVGMALLPRGGAAPGALGPERRARLDALLAAANGASAAAAPRSGERAPLPARTPFVRSRRVHHGDCSVSGDVYAPRVAEWAVEAVGEWYAETLGISWTEQCRRGRGTPFLGIRCEIPRRLEPGAALTLAVSIPRLGRSSIGYAVAGVDERGERCFEAELSACHATEEGGRRSAPFPEPLRERILAYQAAGGGASPRS
jgi:acyl-CoA thioesterase FadM